MRFVGIDYSLTSPCVCAGESDFYGDSYFYYLTGNKKFVGLAHNVFGDFHGEYSNPQERYENIASWVLGILSEFDKKNTYILIEDYSFASHGKVFHIAENCGLLKYLLYKEKYKFWSAPPSVIKKFATGKGNADKLAMYKAFSEQTGVSFLPDNDPVKIGSPISDIVDAFYLKNFMRECILTNNLKPLFKDSTNASSKKSRSI